MIKEFRVFSRKYESKEGKSFLRFSYTKDGETFYDVKFTKDCLNTIKVTGYFKVKADTKNISIGKSERKEVNGTIYNTNQTLWIREVISIVRDDEYEEMLAKVREDELAEIL